MTHVGTELASSLEHDKKQHQIWLASSQTQKELSHLKALHLAQLKASSRVASNVANNDLTLRLHLAKAQVLEKVIELIETGDYNNL